MILAKRWARPRHSEGGRDDKRLTRRQCTSTKAAHAHGVSSKRQGGAVSGSHPQDAGRQRPTAV